MNGRAALNAILSNIGYRPVSDITVGQDPETLCVRGFVIGEHRNTGDPDRFAVWSKFDWTHHPNPKDRMRGLDIQHGRYMLTYGEAMNLVQKQCSELVRRYRWLIPGTADTIPGCRGSCR